MPIWTQWKIAWKSETLPKIKFFIWVLLKGKVLTSDNLKKLCNLGPSRCPNCQATEETIQHLFINFPFTNACWKEDFLKDQLPWGSHSFIAELLQLWKRNYPWQRKKNNVARRVWNALPYSMLWSIWLARNHAIFKNKKIDSGSYTARQEALL